MKKLMIFFVSVAVLFSTTISSVVGYDSSRLIASYDSSSSVVSKNFSYNMLESKDIEVSTYGNKEITRFNGFETIDKTEENIRTITTKSPDGTLSEYVENLETGIANIYTNGRLVETYDIKKLRNEITKVELISEDDLKNIDLAMENLITKKVKYTEPVKVGNYSIPKRSDGSFEISENMSMRSNNRKIYSYGQVTSSYPEYMYNDVLVTSRYSSELQRTLLIRVKDSMYSYVNTSRTIKEFSPATALTIVAGVAKISFGNALGIFTGSIAIINGVYRLVEACDYYQHEEYKYYAMRGGYAYDYTTHFCFVEVFAEYGTGRLALSWDWDHSQGVYFNPRWTHVALARPFANFTTSQIADETLDIWEYTMYMWGYWRWGIGW